MTEETTEYPDNEESNNWTTVEAEETPVPDYRCVRCKRPAEEWEEDVPRHELTTGEALCNSCLTTLRSLHRTPVIDGSAVAPAMTDGSGE